MVEYLEYPYIRSKTIQARVYQQMLFGVATKNNALIVLPTGLGKTVIFIMVIAHYLSKYPNQKIIITAPTRPLVNQHMDSAIKMLNLDYEDIQVISGEINPDNRNKIWQTGKVFISTPQTLRNDIISKKLNLSTVSLICFDEAHRAIGDDPYVLCAQEFAKENPSGRRLGFTASPGNKEKIFELLQNLKLDEFEYMDEDHHLVKPYTHNVDENWLWVDLPDEFQKMIHLLENQIKDFLQFLKDLNVINSIVIKNNPKSKILLIPKKLNKRRDELSDDDFFGGMSVYGQLMLFYQAVEMLETQGVHTLNKYIEDKIQEYNRTNKSSLRRFIQNPNIKKVFTLSKDLVKKNIAHPKLTKLKELVESEIRKNKDSRILIFANYKATTSLLVSTLKTISEVSVHRFVGQTSSTYGKGLTQKEQKEVMEDFKLGIYNVLVSTSVGEEGLDVAQCDLVIFYDVTPSATRLIQRSGRTGRARDGKVVILITRNTRDEGYFYASRRQKQKIKNSVKEIKSEISQQKEIQKQSSLDDYFEDKSDTILKTNEKQKINQEMKIEFSQSDVPIVYIDYRERGSSLVRKLLNANLEIRQVNLPIGDFVLSDRVAIERKTTRDFTSTLIRGDLFEQLIELKNTYRKPIFLIEGEDLYSSSMSKNAILGAVSSIMVDYDIPIIYAKNEEETIEMITMIASREQKDKKREPVIRSNKNTDNLLEEQLFLIASLPNINNILAERILSEFKNPKNFLTASKDDLKKIHGIGNQIASRIIELLETSFYDNQ